MPGFERDHVDRAEQQSLGEAPVAGRQDGSGELVGKRPWPAHEPEQRRPREPTRRTLGNSLRSASSSPSLGASPRSERRTERAGTPALAPRWETPVRKSRSVTRSIGRMAAVRQGPAEALPAQRRFDGRGLASARLAARFGRSPPAAGSLAVAPPPRLVQLAQADPSGTVADARRARFDRGRRRRSSRSPRASARSLLARRRNLPGLEFGGFGCQGVEELVEALLEAGDAFTFEDVADVGEIDADVRQALPRRLAPRRRRRPPGGRACRGRRTPRSSRPAAC